MPRWSGRCSMVCITLRRGISTPGLKAIISSWAAMRDLIQWAWEMAKSIASASLPLPGMVKMTSGLLAPIFRINRRARTLRRRITGTSIPSISRFLVRNKGAADRRKLKIISNILNYDNNLNYGNRRGQRITSHLRPLCHDPVSALCFFWPGF